MEKAKGSPQHKFERRYLMASLRYGVEGWRKPKAHLNTSLKGGI